MRLTGSAIPRMFLVAPDSESRPKTFSDQHACEVGDSASLNTDVYCTLSLATTTTPVSPRLSNISGQMPWSKRYIPRYLRYLTLSDEAGLAEVQTTTMSPFQKTPQLSAQPDYAVASPLLYWPGPGSCMMPSFAFGDISQFSNSAKFFHIVYCMNGAKCEANEHFHVSQGLTLS